MRASVICEQTNVPSVSLVCEGFEKQAQATARGLGCDGLALAVLRGHVDSQSTEDMIASFLAHTVDEVVAGLTHQLAEHSTYTNEPRAQDIVASGTLDEINSLFVSRGWSDGNPIIPPTIERVESMIAEWGYDPWREIGTGRPSGRDMTIWSIAVNAVMAGCHPDYLPVLVAIAEVLANPEYGVEHSGNTTGADALMIVSGPVVRALGFNHGVGALREGTHANTAVSRWLRLYQRNVCGFTTDEHDKATFGNSTRVVLAEDDDALASLGWQPLSAEFGIPQGTDSITIGRINSGLIIGSVFGSTPAEIIPYLADGLVRVTGWDLTHVFGIGQGHYRPLLVLSPVLANIFAQAGWSQTDVKQALFNTARIPAWKFEALIGTWSNLTAGHRTLIDLVANNLVPAEFALSDDPNRLVPIVTAPDKFLLAVSGDPNRTNAYVMSNDGPHGYWTAQPIDRTYSTDLVCAVPN
jgi:hypothetical protein